MDTLKELTLFFKFSAKRKHILHDHFQSSKDQEDFLTDCTEDDLVQKRNYQGLPVLSDTRWLTRVDSIDCLLKNYRVVCEAVEAVRDCSTGHSANDADSFLKRLLSFEFVVSAIICRHVLAFTRPLTVALQAQDCDLYKAHRMAQRLVKILGSKEQVINFIYGGKLLQQSQLTLTLNQQRRELSKDNRIALILLLEVQKITTGLVTTLLFLITQYLTYKQGFHQNWMVYSLPLISCLPTSQICLMRSFQTSKPSLKLTFLTYQALKVKLVRGRSTWQR